MMGSLAVVQVPAYREPDMRPVLDRIAEQKAPVGWSIQYEAWVTLDNHDNETWSVAQDHDAFEANEAPPGKLSARNAAHDHAFDGDATAVVTWDADAMPKDDTVLTHLLPPLSDQDGVIATNGNPMPPPSLNPVNVITTAVSRAEDVVRPHMHGQLSAFHRGAWLAAGRFFTDLDQTDSLAVRREEEFNFYKRLSFYGDVKRVPDAVVYEEPRRVLYRLNKAAHSMSGGRYPLTEWENERGDTTFDTQREH